MSMPRHLRFISRTVLVQNNDIDTAYRALDRYYSIYNDYHELVIWQSCGDVFRISLK